MELNMQFPDVAVLQQVAHNIGQIQNVGSTNTKLELLRSFGAPKSFGHETFKKVLRFMYDPYHRTGISTKKLEAIRSMVAAKDTNGILPCFIPLEDAMEYFTLHNTGSDADLSFAASFIYGVIKHTHMDPFSKELAEGLVTQNLKIGVTAKSLNKVYGKGFIPIVGCMLGTSYKDLKVEDIKWPCIVTEKLDGIRRILIKENGTISMYSRSGHADVTCVDILKEAEQLPDNFVYDGELLAIGKYADNIEVRQATNSLTSSKADTHDVTFNVFDMVPVRDFYEGECRIPAKHRKAMLAMLFGVSYVRTATPPPYNFSDRCLNTPHIIPVPIICAVKSIEAAKEAGRKIWERGGEGVMLNTAEAPYVLKRSKELIKVKRTIEMRLKIVGLERGTGRNASRVGAFYVDYKGNKVGVGSGLSDFVRDDAALHPEKYIGRIAEIETFGQSRNAAGDISINCPIYKRLVGEEE